MSILVISKRTPITGSQAIVDFISISQALIVADQASFSQAARVLGVKQSAVSRRIQALEDELGVSLFERQSNGVRPTIAGRRFFERARTAFAEIDLAVKNAAAAGRGEEGMIRIGILPSLLSGFLRDVLSEFRETLKSGSIRHDRNRVSRHAATRLSFAAGHSTPPLALA